MASAVCSRRSSATSTRSSTGTNATWLTQKGRHAMGKGQVLFTGPSGIRDYRTKVITDDRMVGIGTMSAEGTAEIGYIWREAPGTAPPIRRGGWAGEIGWLIPQFKDWRNFTSGHQMTKSEFRKAQDEKFTHRWQEPWYPSPTHPDYNKQYKFLNTPYNNDTSPAYARSKTPGPNYAKSSQASPPPYQRPHTVASFRQDENLPFIDGHSNSNSRPGSGGQYSSASGHSVSHTPVASRPSSGGVVQQGTGSTPVHSRPASSVSNQGAQNSRDAHSLSRPSSGASSHYSRDSHGSYRSHTGSHRSHKGSIGRHSHSGSRHSSARSGTIKKLSATPSSTSYSSQYGGGKR